MRWWLAMVLGFVLVPAVQAQDTAQKLYEAMAQKLAKAKAHKIEIACDFFAGEARSLKGTLIVAEGDRFKAVMDIKHPMSQIKVVWVSDGKTMAAKEDGAPAAKTAPLPEKLYENSTLLLTRGGVLVTLLWLEKEAKTIKDFGALKTQDFKMLAKEKVGDRQALVIEYRLSFPETKDPATCKMWLDTETHLPLKRTLEMTMNGEVKFRTEETYGRWELDPKLPEGTFTLPK